MNRNAAKFQILVELEKKFVLPMLCLSFVWLLILIFELINGTQHWVQVIGTIIWVLFIFYFIMRLLVAAKRLTFLKKNWLFVLAILVSVLRFFPLLQTFPLLRALTATFGMQVIWIFTSADQGMRGLGRALGRRGVGYVLVFTLVVIFVGATGMLYYERNLNDPHSLQTYPRALWWTAMQITNIGSGYTIMTTGGRIFCLGISIYAAGMFGYLTALFATIFIGRDAKDPKSEISNQSSIEDLKKEIIQLRVLIEDVVSRFPKNKL